MQLSPRSAGVGVSARAWASDRNRVLRAPSAASSPGSCSLVLAASSMALSGMCDPHTAWRPVVPADTTAPVGPTYGTAIADPPETRHTVGAGQRRTAMRALAPQPKTASQTVDRIRTPPPERTPWTWHPHATPYRSQPELFQPPLTHYAEPAPVTSLPSLPATRQG